MPSAWEFRFLIKKKQQPAINPSLFHSLFYEVLKAGDKKLANQVHKMQPFKPLTIAFRNSKVPSIIIRISFLQDSLSKVWVEYLLNFDFSMSILHPQQITFSSIGRSDWTQEKSYSQIWEDSNPAINITLLFASATSFRQGDVDLPLPIPKLVFGSYLEKWNMFSGMPFPEDLKEKIERHLAVAEYRIKTVPFNDGRVIIPGFVGKVVFKIIGRLDEQSIKQINCLADFAFYAGTGRKTTHGMGMTRRVG